MASFGDRLAAAVESKDSVVCVGLDPRWQSLPKRIIGNVDSADLPAVAAATELYCREIIDSVASLAPVVKPQAAFFELLGPWGMQALYSVIQHARHAGMLVLLDAKRGDIGSTAEGYADAYLGKESPWQCDALTVNPYLGDDSVQPFIDVANDVGAGVIVLVKTSNPGSGFLQDQQVGSVKVYEKMADMVQAQALASCGASGYGNIGAVVGATYPHELSGLRNRMPNAWLLVPGFGAQGGQAEDVAGGFDRRGGGAIVNSSRGIIFAYQKPEYSQSDWQDAVFQAAADMREQLNQTRRSAGTKKI
ncbi:MAG: orotidine-5'-phosphate decarboxylase [Planctomycetales bacterium]|nr:orotidine-5'-phosphate decarboxylase [Planctomycetales bacterium]